MTVHEIASPERLTGGQFLLGGATSEFTFTLEDCTAEHIDVARMTADFALEQVFPQIAAIERKDFSVLRGLMRQAGDLGLLAADVPEEYGGVEMDKVTSALIADQISVSGSFSVAFGGQVGIGLLPLLWYGNETQKKKYLPRLVTGHLLAAYALSESSAGSDAMNIRTRAALSPDGSSYILNGEKMWITNAGFADLFTVFAKIDGEKFSAFLIDRDTPGLSIGSEEHKLGLRGSSTCALILNNCKVPVANLLGEPGKGHHIAFNILNVGRYKLAATGLGAARQALRDGIRYGRDRVSFGKPITSFGLVQQMIARSAADIFALESTLYRVVGAIDSALTEIDRTSPFYTRDVQRCIEEFAAECSALKVFGSEVLDGVVDDVLQIYGGYGYVEEYPAERHYRDARIHRIFEGTNEVNRMIIVNWTLKRANSDALALHPAMEQAIKGATGTSNEVFEGPLAAENSRVFAARRISLIALNLATQRFGKSLANEQEVVGALADVFIQLLAMESCVLRAEKMRIPGTAVSLTRYFVANAFSIVRNKAEQILAATLEGDDLAKWTAALSAIAAQELTNTVLVGRDIAVAMVAAGQYVL